MKENYSSIGDLIRKRWLAVAGRTQKSLSDESGVSTSDINALLKGKVLLPGADKRRRLAKVLGVSHLDLLIIAGEITEGEARGAGANPIIERDPNARRERLIQRIREMPDGFGVDEGLEVALGVLEAAVKRGREGKGV